MKEEVNELDTIDLTPYIPFMDPLEMKAYAKWKSGGEQFNFSAAKLGKWKRKYNEEIRKKEAIFKRDETTEIVDRFFSVLDILISKGDIPSVSQFANEVGASRSALTYARKDYKKGTFRAHWISYLVKNHKANPMFILIGEGGEFV